MEKDLQNDNFKGALFQNFEEEVVTAPEIVWDKIEKELFPKKKNKGFIWLSSIMLISLISTTTYFLFLQNPSEKKISDKTKTKVIFDVKKQSNSQIASVKNNSTVKTSQEKGNNELNTNNTLNQQPEKQFSINDTKTNQLNNTQLVNSINSPENQKIETKIVVENQPFSSIDTNRQEIQLFRFPYLQPILLGSVITLKTIIEKAKSKNCNQTISFQASINRGINVRKIEGEFNTQNMKSKTIGERRIPTSLTQYQFGFNYHLNDKFAINSGMNFGKSTFQSRWFYRQLYVNSGENAVELRTMNGDASLNDQEIISELSNGDTVLYKIRANYAASFFSIPVGFTYRFKNKKLSPFFRYGISLDFHSKAAISIDIQKNGAYKTFDLNLTNNSVQLALQQMASFGFDYQLKENWSAFLESRLAIPISKINVSTDNKVKSSYLTLGIGIKYTLPCTNQNPKK